MNKKTAAQIISKHIISLFSQIEVKFGITLKRPHLTADEIEKYLRKAKNENRYFLESEFEESLLSSIFSIEPPKLIYHYTTIDALKSIIENKELHLTSIAGMNDKSEITYSDSLLNIGKKFRLTYQRVKQYNRRFIICFTNNKDHFNHWRLYGNNGNGVAIGFRYNTPVNSEYYIALGKIFYGEDLPNMMIKLFEDVEREIKFQFSFRRLYLWKNFFKHKDYEYESETRLLFFNRESSKYNRLKKFFKINYYRILVPFVKIEFSNPSYPLELAEVILGPNIPEVDLNLHQLRYILDELSIKNVSIQKSAIDHFRG